MNKISFLSASVLLTFLILPFTSTFGEEVKPIPLLKPQLDIGKPLMQVLKERSSSRSFSTEKLPVQVFSNLLWTAFSARLEILRYD